MITNGDRRHGAIRLRVRPTVAVVGLGYWGPNLLRALIERTDVKVRWVCDLDASRLERFGRRYPSVQLSQDLDQVLDDPELDGVLLATPGSKKMVVYEDGSPEAIRIFDRGVVYKDPETFGEYHVSCRAGDIRSPHLSNDEPLALQVGDFVRAIRTGELPEHGLALASDVVRLAEAADASLDRGGAQISLAQISLGETHYARVAD